MCYRHEEGCQVSSNKPDSPKITDDVILTLAKMTDKWWLVLHCIIIVFYYFHVMWLVISIYHAILIDNLAKTSIVV